MTISEYLEAQELTAAAFADRIAISRSHLSHLMAGRQRASAELAVRIDKATGGAVSKASLRPDLFDDVAAEATE